MSKKNQKLNQKNQKKVNIQCNLIQMEEVI